MTSKERIKAVVSCQPVDRLPFWPKLDGAYAYKWGKPTADYHAYIGSDYIAGIGHSYVEKRENTAYSEQVHGDESETCYETPYGVLKMRKRFDSASQSWHPVEHPIKTKEDIEIMAYWFGDAEVAYDKARHEDAMRQYQHIGDAYVIDDMGESSLMVFIEWLAGVEQGHYLLNDYPGETEALFDAIHRNLLARFEISAEHSPADALHLTENTSTTLISPAQYEQYCFPQISAYGGYNRPLMLHMCGHLKDLLPQLNQLPVLAFEAFTSPSVGNATLLDGRTACPDKCLIGGTNCVTWLNPAEQIVAYLREQLDVLPHHRGLCISSAGVMPPICAPETIKAVKQWLDSYPIRM